MSYLFNRNVKDNYSSIVVHLTEKSILIMGLEWVNNKCIVSRFRRFIVSNSANYLSLIRKKIKSYNFKNKQVLLLISDSCTSRHYIKVSKKLNNAELDAIAKIEIKKNTYNVCFDYFVMDDKQSEYYKIVIITTKYNVVINKIKFLNHLGLKVKLVDVESNCLLKMANMLAHNTIIWIELSENTIKIFLIKNRELISIHEDSYVGSNFLINEKIFIEIISKIERVFLGYDFNFVEKIYLSGSYMQLNNLRDILAYKNSIPVVIFDELQLLGIESTNGFCSEIIKKQIRKSAIAFGMAFGK